MFTLCLNAYEYSFLQTEELVLALAADSPWERTCNGSPAANLNDFSHQTCLFSAGNSVYRKLEKTMLQLHGFTPLDRRVVRERAALLQMVRDGVGVALLLHSEAEGDPELRFYRLVPTLPVYHVLAHNKNLPETETVRGLIELLSRE